MSSDEVRPAWAEEIRERRLRLCWTQNEMARQLESAADDRTRTQLPSRSSIIREIRFHESGTHRPGPIYAELYRRVWERLPEFRVGLPASVGPQDDGEGIESDDPTRILAQARAVLTSNVDHRLLEMAHRSIEHVVARYELLGPWPLIPEARSLRETLHALLEGRQSPAQRTELYSLAGRAAGLLAYMSVNIGRPNMAEAYCTEADLLAQEVGDVELRMWSLGTRSFGLYYQGRYDEADKVAACAVDLAPSSPQAIRVLVNGRARASARMSGTSGQAERMIGEALRLSDQTDDLPDGMSPCIAFAPYSPARTVANAVTAFLSLGQPKQVLEYADQLDELVESSQSRWSKALVRLDVASALVAQRSPEVERAMALGCEALEMASAAPIKSVGQRARELAGLVSPWAEKTEVGDYRQRLDEWFTRPLAQAINEDAPGRTR
ncbi:hypothetical protein [Actinomadura hibisca]|uniref:hypothetical protein n=1 Tax=Actinomadura hibisca TaxID=68565 RepID=UPI00082F53EB|nr:hypothetical protein [Actinomadura hibisca]